MKKTASKVAEPTKIQPKPQFLFQKNLALRDFSIMPTPSEISCENEWAKVFCGIILFN